VLVGEDGDFGNVVVGERLRDARRRLGWSLADVEEASGGAFRASAVGAYERGERAVSAIRLAGLARLYGVSAAVLLDDLPDGDAVIDLTVLESEEPARAAVVDRAVAVIRALRRSPGSAEVRRSDLRVLAALVGSSLAAASGPNEPSESADSPREPSQPSV